jgi:hypothetical protein
MKVKAWFKETAQSSAISFHSGQARQLFFNGENGKATGLTCHQ